MVTHLEPDILECKVSWALESITMNKASGSDGILGELFQILKDDAALNMSANLENSAVATALEKVSFIPIPKKSMPKNAQPTTQLHSFHMLTKKCSKFSKLSFSSTKWTKQLPDVQAGFRKGREARSQIASILWIIEKAREFQKNLYFCFSDYTKAFDYVDQNKL